MAKRVIINLTVVSIVLLLAGHASAVVDPSLAGGKADGSLLQFKSGNHILGFTPERIYMVGMGYALIEEFVGANKVVPVSAGSVAAEGNRTGAPPFMGVEYKELWKGITLKYVPAKRGVAESVYVIGPGAEPNDIKIRYNTKTEIQKDGTLRLTHPTKRGHFTQSAPVAWQEIHGEKKAVEVAFKSYGDSTIGFELGNYDRQHPVIIDPTYQWHTFYGAHSDHAFGIAVDVVGGIYITGRSDDTWNGDGGSTPLHPHSGGGNSDIFVLKLDRNGLYKWHTFYGSLGSDWGTSIATDRGGNVYVVGCSSDPSWNGDGNLTPKNSKSGLLDIVILKLDGNGVYQWHTFYGSSNQDEGSGIAVDGDGNVYITGYSTTSWRGAGGTEPRHAHTNYDDIVILKLDSNGEYQWHTFYGRASYGKGIAVDLNGNVYVTGYSGDIWNGDGDVAPIHWESGSADVVILKLDTNGVYQWHTFYGRRASGNSISLDELGNLYVAGNSYETWNGADVGGSPLNPHSGLCDLFVLKLDSTGTYQWHTFYPSSVQDCHADVAVDTAGNIYVTGKSQLAWNGDRNEEPLHSYSYRIDMVVLKLDTNGAYQWHTFYGSNNDEWGNGVVVDEDANVYVTGFSNSTWNADDDAEPLRSGASIVKVKDLPDSQPLLGCDVTPPVRTWS